MNSPQAIVYLSFSTLISFLFYGIAITCLISATVSASYDGNETDYHALLSFKSNIAQDPYQVLTSWNHSFHFCEWSGVSCGKRHKRVTALRLGSLGLEGSVSPNVGNLSFLRELSLKNNSFQGTIPHELGRLSRLRHLYLHKNKFSGVIPTNLSRCSNLETLWLAQNNLTGSIPKEMSSLSKLDDLVIDRNKLTGGIPPFLGNITSMVWFSAARNPFGGSIPDILGLWKSLLEFDCGDCNLNGSIPRSFFNLSLLVNFSLPGNHLTGSLPLEIGNQLPNIEYIQLRDNKLTGVVAPSISNCSKLRHLEISNNSLSGKLTIDFSKLRYINDIYLGSNNFHGRGEADDMRFIDSLKNCTRLVYLYLDNCNLKGVLPISIGSLSDQFRFLSLAFNQLSGSVPSSIGSLVGLTIVDLQYNLFNGKIPTTIFKLQKLEYLDLSSNHFSGAVPDAIGNLSLLTKLYFESNKLEGHIPPSLGNCKVLNGLNLSHNRLSGQIPKQLLQLPSLTNFLDLSYNNVSGTIPSEIKDLKMLSYLDLSYNNLSGAITSSLGECISLTVLNLSGNILHGFIPSSLRSLRGLEVLDISQNNLSGKIPQFFDKRFSLEFLNLSFNDFEGEVPVVGVFANASAFSVLGNKRLCGGLVILELPKCKERGRHKIRFPFFILVILIASTFLIVLCCVYFLCKKKRNSQPSQSLGHERFLKVSYNELLKATDGFSTENLIGEGGFSSVYKGILDSYDDKFVAVKVLHLQNRGAHKSFLAECEAWRNIRHRNLLRIITSCSSTDFQGNDFKALVYELMSNGSVHDWLHSSKNTSKLNLFQRINILRDVATALDYLHNCCPTTIVHGDLKPSNILLDADMVAHVGDYGLARLLGTDLNQNSSTGVKGTIGYAPPEYGLGSEMSCTGDIYSFGILLLEVMTGKKPMDSMFNEGLSLHNFAYMALPDHVIDVIDDDAIVLQSTQANAKKVEECLVASIKIGVSCSVDSPQQRMKIETVVNELQRQSSSLYGTAESNCKKEQRILSIICLTFAMVSTSYGGNAIDYYTLLSFKSMITQDPYQVLTSSNHSFHFCDWSGEADTETASKVYKVIGVSPNEGRVSDPKTLRNMTSDKASNAPSARTKKSLTQLHGDDFPEVKSTNVIREMPHIQELGDNGGGSSSDSSVNFRNRSVVRFLNENGSPHYNIDGIADVLLALDRIEQDAELTYEQLLALETNLFLGGLNLYDQHRDMRLDIDNMSYEELLVLEEKMGTVITALSEEELSKCIMTNVFESVQLEKERTRSNLGADDSKCGICQEESKDSKNSFGKEESSKKNEKERKKENDLETEKTEEPQKIGRHLDQESVDRHRKGILHYNSQDVVQPAYMPNMKSLGLCMYEGFVTVIVEALAVRTITWENERGTEFNYDGIRLLSMLEEYKILRQEREEERKQQRPLYMMSQLE
uniref:non-specific serine/threonine protein kinase n=1 Tax=Tanacetum cinerariifolium TaxID=118510 RepID=A0A6L2LJ87_TANCI|nr:leucine-rich repeat protein [Tanacetum cinerariifolium]